MASDAVRARLSTSGMRIGARTGMAELPGDDKPGGDRGQWIPGAEPPPADDLTAPGLASGLLGPPIRVGPVGRHHRGLRLALDHPLGEPLEPLEQRVAPPCRALLLDV